MGTSQHLSRLPVSEEIISQCVWLYFNFAVSLREVELIMAFRGVQLSYETIRRWCDKLGASYAAKLKRRRPETPGQRQARFPGIPRGPANDSGL